MDSIHSSAFIGIGVVLGSNVTIGPNAVILGPCEIGNNVWIGPNTVIGGPPEINSLPQNSAWAGDIQHAGVIIEKEVVIREGVAIHQGSHRPTRICFGAWILNHAYLAHDVYIGAETTISAGVSVGGHCVVGERANIGMNASIHQRRIIGSGAMVGMGTPVTKDIPPYAKAFGNPVSLRGANSVSLQKLGVSVENISTIDSAYHRGSLSTNLAAEEFDSIRTEIDLWLAQAPERIL